MSRTRIKVKDEFLEKSYGKGLGLFLIDLFLFAAVMYGALVAESVLLRFICSLFAGLFMAFLFLLAHDADHGSLTRNRWVNRVLGTIAFLPVLHPYNIWILAHHHHHHRHTNLAGDNYDYVWNPYSKEEFDALPKYRQVLEKLYRSPFGHGLYYMTEIWWKKLFFPTPSNVKGGYTKAYVWDLVILTAFAVFEIGGIIILAETGVITQPWWSALIFAVLIPHLAWNWYIGFFLLLQHNHPDIRWYKDIDEWKKESGPPGDTAHFVFPRLINLIVHGVDEHAGHHLSPNVPIYNLGKLQRYLDEEHSEAMPSYKWTPSTYMKILKHCQLYDYKKHQWLGFDGSPSEPIGEPKYPASSASPRHARV